MKTTKSAIETTIISSDDEENVYEIRKTLQSKKEKAKTLVVIMLCPAVSPKNILKCDNTTQKLLDHLHDFNEDISTLRLLNLFSKIS